MTPPRQPHADSLSSPPDMGQARVWGLPYLALFTLAAGLFFTWPLPAHFFSAVPYTLFPIPGYEQTPLAPGDYLQTYYWFWVFSDTVLGHSPWLTNIYEFNAGDTRLVSQFANFPMSAVWTLFLPLGPVGAYNALVLLAPVLTALTTFKLARAQGVEDLAAWPAALAMAFCPILFSQIAVGQLMGMVACLLPLTFIFVEKAWSGRRLASALGAAICLVTLGLMEPHLTYFTSLCLGLYLPGRLLMCLDEAPAGEVDDRGGPAWAEAAWVLAGGLALGLFAGLHLARQPGAGPFAFLLSESLVLWPLAALVAWLVLASLLARLRGLGFAAARRATALPFLGLTPMVLYMVQFAVTVPHLGAALLVLGPGALALGQILAFWRAKGRPAPLAWRSLGTTALGVGLGLGAAGGHLVYLRLTSYLDSMAGKGRGLSEIILFSPQPFSLFAMTLGQDERYVLLGFTLLSLALLGLLPLLGRRAPVNFGRRALALLLAFLATLLAMGPAISTLPLYRLLHAHLPFFRYPRVPGRFIVLSVLFLGMLAAWGLADARRWLRKKGWSPAAALLPALAILGLGWEFYAGPPGISFIPPDNRVIARLAAEPRETGLVLELPIWPGDSHQSSLYEYDVTRTRRPMVNGYSPFVTRQYLEQVFQPLYPLDLGRLGDEQAAHLARLKVGRVTFHEDASVYPIKVSPFPPSLALRRLEASGWLEPLEHDGNTHLFGLRQRPLPPLKPPIEVTTPVNMVFYAQEMRMERGTRAFDPQASGHGLLLDQKANQSRGPVYRRGAQGNTVRVKAGYDPPGPMVRGPARTLPPGSYLARFRLRASDGAPAVSPGRLEIGPPGQTLASRDLEASEFAVPGQWVDAPLPFAIDEVTPLEFRVLHNGTASLEFNLVVAGFAGVAPGPGRWEAEDLFRQTGETVDDAKASGGKAVEARAGYHPPIYMMHGPYQTMEPGSYLARFHLRAPDQSRGVTGKALLEVATDMGRRVLGQREISLNEMAGRDYVAKEVPFVVPFRCELDLRVRFPGGGDLLADRVEVVAAPKP